MTDELSRLYEQNVILLFSGNAKNLAAGLQWIAVDSKDFTQTTSKQALEPVSLGPLSIKEKVRGQLWSCQSTRL